MLMRRNVSWRKTVKRIKKGRRAFGMKDWDFPSRQKQLWKDKKRKKNPITAKTIVKLPVSALRKLVKAVKRGESAVVRAVRVR